MDRHLIHPSPTGHLVHDRLVPHPLAQAADVDVWFALPEQADSPTTWEALRCLRLDHDRVRVCAVPLFAYDLGWGDEVTVVASGEGPLVATSRTVDAGAVTFRVFLDRSDPATEPLQTVVQTFGRLGCLIEGYSEQLLGLSCEAVTGEGVAEHLAAAEGAGRLQYETGRQRS